MTRPYHNITSTSKENKAGEVINECREGRGGLAILNYLHFLTLTTFSHCWWLGLLPARAQLLPGSFRGSRALQIRGVCSREYGILQRSTSDSLPPQGCRAMVPMMPWNLRGTINQLVVNWPVFLALITRLPRYPPSHCWQ